MSEDWHSQGWLSIVDALGLYAGPEVGTPRQCRARERPKAIATRVGLLITVAPRQSEFSWSGP